MLQGRLHESAPAVEDTARPESRLHSQPGDRALRPPANLPQSQPLCQRSRGDATASIGLRAPAPTRAGQLAPHASTSEGTRYTGVTSYTGSHLFINAWKRRGQVKAIPLTPGEVTPSYAWEAPSEAGWASADPCQPVGEGGPPYMVEVAILSNFPAPG